MKKGKILEITVAETLKCVPGGSWGDDWEEVPKQIFRVDFSTIYETKFEGEDSFRPLDEEYLLQCFYEIIPGEKHRTGKMTLEPKKGYGMLCIGELFDGFIYDGRAIVDFKYLDK